MRPVNLVLNRALHLLHSFTNLLDLWMDFANQIMFNLRERFDAFALGMNFREKVGLPPGNAVHPRKANGPAACSYQSQK